jgi:hypothetical protein
MSGRRLRDVAAFLSLVLAAQLALVAGFPLPYLRPGRAAAGPASGPVPPPGAVNPAPAVQTVTTSGATHAPAEITTDTVWGPVGSPYIVSGTSGTIVRPGASLTLLPGTVVKLDTHAQLDVNAGAQLVAIGTPNAHVVITSLRDDTVLGDTNGDGTATTPAPGDWYTVSVEGQDPPVVGVQARRPEYTQSRAGHANRPSQWAGKAGVKRWPLPSPCRVAGLLTARIATYGRTQ